MESDRLELAAAAINALIVRLLRSGHELQANMKYAPYLIKLDVLAEELGIDFGWQIQFTHARLEYAIGRYADVWPYMVKALEKSDNSVPKGKEISFTISWMNSRAGFQAELASIAIDLNRRLIIPSEELLRVYEFNNGREIRARLAGVGTDFSPSGVLSQVSAISAATAMKVHLVFCFDRADMISFGYFASGSSGLVMLPEEIPVRELNAAWDRIRTDFKFANPGDPSSFTGSWNAWDLTWSAFAGKLQLLAGEGGHICFLPGRTCTAMPLHLIRCPGGETLAEKYSVSYAPNLATLLDDREIEYNDPRSLIVAVSKQTDSDLFRSNLGKTVTKLAGIIGKTGNPEILGEEKAHLQTILETMPGCKETLFLTHGSYGGPLHGNGICISDGEYLPPALLPVEDVPELKRFLLTWEDVEKMEKSPIHVISVACSSGITTVSQGGVRFGLEQSLFASGTRVIISPLWDVEQAPALSWIEHFFELKNSSAGNTLAEIVRHCAMDMRKDFPFPYLWAPFILNGSLKQSLSYEKPK